MSEQVAPALIQDPLEFARGRKCLEGDIALVRLDRLHDLLAATDGAVHFKLTGFVNDSGAPGLRCEVQGTLKLSCQRCLEPMDHRLQIDTALLLTNDEQALEDDDPDTPECVPIQRDMSVSALVEDEILLALPMAPHHAEDVCRGRPAAEPGKLHPFAALARLKTNKE
jgi:uncharacterized protein